VRIAFLIHNAYGIGGTIRTTGNLAAALAERHDVEIASVFRHRASPRFAVDPRVRLTPLTDIRPVGNGTAGGRDSGSRRPPEHRPPLLFPAGDGRIRQYSRATDRSIAAWLAATDAEVIAGTRAGLNVMLAHHGPRRSVRIAQEHLTLDGHRPALRGRLLGCYPLLDAIVTVTEADAEAHRRRLAGIRVEAIPNSVPQPGRHPHDEGSRVVVAAGRFEPTKRFDLLVDAFAEVARVRPDWRLHLYGDGPCLGLVRERVERHGLRHTVRLMGTNPAMEEVWAAGAIAVVSSDAESFGMTLVEAMRSGLPVVSTDCPLGPREIIHEGEDGLLVPVGNRRALAEALLYLINDDERRARMAGTARRAARRFDPAAIARRHESLFEELLDQRRSGTAKGPSRTRAARAAVSYATAESAFRAARHLAHRVQDLRTRGGGA
jgi:glycosyltransferase involved in cell wall biosynthesis